VSVHPSRIVLTCIGLIGAGPVVAQEGAAADHPCASIADDSQRLACYDEAFGRPRVVAASSPAAAPAAKVVVTDPVEEFGLSEAAKRARDPEKAKETMPEQISARVTKVGNRPTGELVVTLESGQVWVQIETVSKAKVKPGDTVTIKKGALGSYLLVAPNRVATTVRRVR
jgi:hypothetical protein